MSAITFPEYARHIQALLNGLIDGGQALTVQLQVDQRSIAKGLLAGTVYFSGSTELHFREYVDLTEPGPHQMYAYHSQTSAGELVFRYDNAVHRPPLAARDHKHTPAGILITDPPTLAQVIDEILDSRTG